MRDAEPCAVDPNATTTTLKRKTMAIPTLTPETKIVVQLGGAIAVLGFVAWLSITAYKIQTNSETALANQAKMTEDVRSEFKALSEDIKPLKEKVDKLWWEYERSASMPGRHGAAGP